MRLALIADTHLSARSPECVANWHAARRAVERLEADLTVHLGDITLDGQSHGEELEFASRLIQHWPTEIRCVPGNHDLGDGPGESPLHERLLRSYKDIFGPDHWMLKAGNWQLLGINAQLLGTDSELESALWEWIANQAALQLATRTPRCFCTAGAASRSGELMPKGRYVSHDAPSVCSRVRCSRRFDWWRQGTRISTSTPWSRACATCGCRQPPLFFRMTCKLESAKSWSASVCST